MQLRRQVEAVRLAELENSLGKLGHLAEKDREQIGMLTQAIVNMILHSPLTVLKESSRTADAATYLEVARRLFNVRDPLPGEKGGEGDGAR